MDNYIILIFSGIILLIAGVIVALHIHYKRIITEKERGILHHIHEQDRLMKEMEHINVEKKVVERMLEKKFDAMFFFTAKTQTREGTKARKHEASPQPPPKEGEFPPFGGTKGVLVTCNS
ncbi:MAG: hypothetical protein FWF09_03910 [Bacteroidales bacterium]|nr:hypothetical protein [Bacteroidales bacterium]